MTTYILLYLCNLLEKKIECEAVHVTNIVSVFPNECNKFKNTGDRMQDCIYHTTLQIILFTIHALNHQSLPISKRIIAERYEAYLK